MTIPREEIPTPITAAHTLPGSDIVHADFASELEKDRVELISALDYWLNGTQKSQARFAEDAAMLARMRERK